MWPGLEVGETRPHWENTCLGDSLSAGDGHQCIHVESVFGVVMDAEHHHRAAIAQNLLSKFESHVGLLSVGLVFDASNRVVLDVECECFWFLACVCVSLCVCLSMCVCLPVNVCFCLSLSVCVPFSVSVSGS